MVESLRLILASVAFASTILTLSIDQAIAEGRHARSPSNCTATHRCNHKSCTTCKELAAQPGICDSYVVGPTVEGLQSLPQPQQDLQQNSLPDIQLDSSSSPIPNSATNRPSTSSAVEAAASGLDFSQIAGNNNRNRGGDSAGSQSVFSNAIEFQGDFFGVQPVDATATQVYSATTTNGQLAVNQTAFLTDGSTFRVASLSPDGNTATFTDPSGPITLNQQDFRFVTATGTRNLGGDSFSVKYGFGKDAPLPTNVTGRLKFAENVGLIPRNRFFFNYNYFHNVPLTTTGAIGVNRFTPGFEKTFLDKQASIEVRVPFSATLNSDIFATGTTDQRVQFGNMFVSLKGLLLATDRWATTSGISLSLPTEEDIRVLRTDGTELIRIQNESVHILPFFGISCFPSSRVFAQFLTQVDVDTVGRPVLVNNESSMQDIGRFRDQTLMFNSASIAYRLWTNSGNRRTLVRSIMPTFEVHWNRSLDKSSGLTNSFSTLGNSASFESVNLISGLTLDMRRNSRLAVGYVAPVSRSDTRVFDGELRVLLNKYY